VVNDSRDEALDVVKGALVLFMVLYHWANYYVGQEWEGYRYLRFLTPSFIFITGFLISHVYLQRYPANSPALRSRLVLRGFKLLALFIALNVADTVVGTGSLTTVVQQWPAERLATAFLVGDGGAAFAILLPIAYFCLAAPALLVLSTRLRLSIASLSAVALVGSLVLAGSGTANAHVEQLAIACLGLAAGAGRTGALEQLVRQPGILVVAYAAYLVAITAWDVRYWLQVIGVGLSVALLYVIARLAWWPALGRREVAVLGRYSLLAYVAQIAGLQVLVRIWPGHGLDRIGLAMTLLATAVFTALVVRLTISLRDRSASVDRVYRAVFA
jgi:peptidoglycan/LPS O-acetylase OafA/YrhL